MSAGKLNIFIEQGATFEYVLTLTDETNNPINLTSYKARMQIRRTVQSRDFLIELTTENGRIVISPVIGSITLSISASDTANLSFTQAVYDLEIVSADDVVTRIIQGTVNLSKEVTR